MSHIPLHSEATSSQPPIVAALLHNAGSLVVIFNSLLDLLIGLIPVIGTALDFFHRSYKRNFLLVEGFSQNNPQIIRKVRGQAIFAVVGIAAVGAACAWLIQNLFVLLEQGWQMLLNWL